MTWHKITSAKAARFPCILIPMPRNDVGPTSVANDAAAISGRGSLVVRRVIGNRLSDLVA